MEFDDFPFILGNVIIPTDSNSMIFQRGSNQLSVPKWMTKLRIQVEAPRKGRSWLSCLGSQASWLTTSARISSDPASAASAIASLEQWNSLEWKIVWFQSSRFPLFKTPWFRLRIFTKALVDQTSAGSPWKPMACYHNWQVLKRFRARAPSTHKFSSSFLTGFSPFFTHSPDPPRIFTRFKSENIKGRNFPATFLRKELLKLIQQSKDKAIKARIGKGRASKTFPKSILQIPLTHVIRRNDPYMMKLSLHPKNS